MVGKKSVNKKKVRKSISEGDCYIKAGFGNTIVTITDVHGNAITWSSAGALGFKGSRKGTPFAAQMSAEDVCKKAKDHGLRALNVFLDGPGAGREPAVRAIAASGLKINSMMDVTPIPHNGCRPPKRRRI